MTQEIIILCIAAFAAGFIDAIVGGGGLIQTPATLITLPQYPVATLLGTTKIPSFTGTSIAAYQYAKKIQLKWKLLAIMCGIAVVAAWSGSYCVSLVSNRFMKPIIFGMLILVAIYTYSKKNFGTADAKSIDRKKEIVYGALFAVLIISILGYDFLKASAHAKFVNLATNTGSILFFAKSGHILYQFALPMAACNLIGSFFGARLAMLKGNGFIRIFFLIVVVGTIIRFGYDIFIKK